MALADFLSSSASAAAVKDRVWSVCGACILQKDKHACVYQWQKKQAY